MQLFRAKACMRSTILDMDRQCYRKTMYVKNKNKKTKMIGLFCRLKQLVVKVEYKQIA